jgi:hypothetical protein
MSRKSIKNNTLDIAPGDKHFPNRIIAMNRFLLFLLLSLTLIFASCIHENFYTVNHSYVYVVQQHNDSLYFATLDSGIFRFSPDFPTATTRVGRRNSIPIRSIAFSKEGKCYAASYYSGVHYAAADTLLPIVGLQEPAWSIKINTDGTIWLAGTRGIFKQQADSLVLWNSMKDAHDLAFNGNELAVAHNNGISLFNIETGVLVSEFCKGMRCWSITQFDSLFVGGGQNRCIIINKEKSKTITFGPPKNLLWATALDSAGNLYLATQKGLYFAQKNQDKAVCVGARGICIKSIIFDKKGRLWVGKFVKNPYKKNWFDFLSVWAK